MAKEKLTKQQQVVYDFIREQILSRGYGPTVREIGEHMSIKSPNGVMCHLRALERKGVISRGANKSRAIELTEPLSRLIPVPLKINGIISQGACLGDPDSGDEFNLSTLVESGDEAPRFGLRVTDDSLMEAQIRRGDLLVIQRQSTVRPNQLALVETRGEVKICYCSQEAGQLRIQAVQGIAPPQVVHEAVIGGQVVGVVRDLTIGQNASLAN